MLRLDFGYSFIDRRPVLEKIVERIPASFQLSIGAFMLGLLGIPLGVFAALHRGRWPDQLVRLFTVLGNAVPHWWLGLMLLVLSATYLRIFPLGGMYTEGDGSLAGSALAPGAAVADRRARRLDHLQPLRALGDAGRAGTGLRPHGPGQGSGRSKPSSTATPYATR